MKKILFAFFIFFLVGNVNAKEIIINDISYNLDNKSDIYGKGYYFDADTDILTLDGYNGGVIEFTDKLIIKIRNKSVIRGNGNNIGIKSGELSIYGSGELYIFNVIEGIYSKNLYLDRITLYIDSKEIGIESYDDFIMFYLSKVKIENSDIGVLTMDYLDVNTSSINIINTNHGIDAKQEMNCYFFDSLLYIDTFDECFRNYSEIYLELTTVSLKSKNMITICSEFMEIPLNEIYVSNDGINYHKEDDYSNYQYLKLATKEKIQELLINDNNLVFDVDYKIINDNKNLDDENDVYTSSEYTENEYTNNEFENDLLIENPLTSDNILKSIRIFIVTLIIFLGGLLFVLRSKYARN